jgi:hypothetical protein
MWVKAVEKAGTTDPDKVIDASSASVPNLTGRLFAKMLPNHHITKPVLIGEIQADGQFDDGVEDVRPRRRRRMVGLSCRLEGPDRRLAGCCWSFGPSFSCSRPPTPTKPRCAQSWRNSPTQKASHRSRQWCASSARPAIRPSPACCLLYPTAICMFESRTRPS